jgi:hypothetical protein
MLVDVELLPPEAGECSTHPVLPIPATLAGRVLGGLLFGVSRSPLHPGGASLLPGTACPRLLVCSL